MRDALVIARRELRERSFVFIAAAVLSVMPFLFALLPVGRSMGPTTMVAGVATFLVPLLTIGLAVLLGGSIVSRELFERRLSFYFARPISAVSIWIGKVIAALILIVGTFGIALLPSLAFAQRTWNEGALVKLPEMAVGTLRTALILFLVAHFVSVMARSRSPLALVDMLLAFVALLAAAIILGPLFRQAPAAYAWTRGYLEASLSVAILVAGGWQLARGRTDTRANHRELSRATWVLLGSFMIIAAAYASWVLFPRPSALTNAFAYQAPGGEWMLVRGEARMRGDFKSVFLINRDSGRWIRFPEAMNARGGFFTRDGSAALALQPLDGGASRGGELIIQRLSGDRARIPTGIVVSEFSHFTLSDDLERVAVLTSGTFSIHDVGTGALLASVRLPLDPKSPAPLMFFPDRNTVRLYLHESGAAPHKVHVYELDIPRKRLTLTGELSMFAKWVQLSTNADGSLAVARPVDAPNSTKTIVFDGRTAEVRRTLDTTDPRSHVFLADGRIAGLDIVGANAVLRLYRNDGAVQREVALGKINSGRIIDIGRPDKLIVAIWRGELPQEAAPNLALVDIQRGVIEHEEQSVRCGNAYNWLDPRNPEPNRSGEIVFQDNAGRLWRWNTLTGQETRMFGG